MFHKVFAVCDCYLHGKAHRNAKHLYDINNLTELVEIDEDFYKEDYPETTLKLKNI